MGGLITRWPRLAGCEAELVRGCVVRRLHAADLILLACVAVWGFNVAVTKYAFGHGFSRLSFAGPRFAIATLMFVAVAWPRFGSLR